MSKAKSSIPVRHGFPNPAYGQALNLVRSAPDYRELARLVRAQAKGSKLPFDQLLLQLEKSGVKEKLRVLFDAHVQVPKTDPVVGPPPPVNELYGRFGKGLSVVDVGSGNCSKLTRATGYLSITAVDPQLENTSLVLVALKVTLGEFLTGRDYSETIFSSFMALPQIPFSEWQPITDCDGLHVVPDHLTLLSNKIAVRRSDGMIKVRTGVKDYVDFPIDLPGAVIEPGYMLCPTYKRRRLEVTLGEDVTTEDYSPIIDATPTGYYDLNFTDIGYKFDGVAHELEASNGIVYYINRAGKQQVGRVNVDFHFCLHLEELAQCYILIRLVSWRGMIPPHHGDTMRYFCDRVEIRIQGKPVLASPRWDGASVDRGPLLVWEGGGSRIEYRPPVDGVVSREGGKDLYCKRMWTVDIEDTALDPLNSALAGIGYSLKVDGNFSPGLTECSISRYGADVILRPLKPRVDKLRETSIETIIYLIDRPTLAETQMITGSPFMV